jgi:hypothetical protein
VKNAKRQSPNAKEVPTAKPLEIGVSPVRGLSEFVWRLAIGIWSFVIVIR